MWEFSFSVRFLSYLTIHVIVAILAVSIYLEKVISYIALGIHLFSLENIFPKQVTFNIHLIASRAYIRIVTSKLKQQ